MDGGPRDRGGPGLSRAARLVRACVAGVLLLASGAAALAHEAAWPRLFAPLAGAGIGTHAAVVAGTLLGLALGAAVGGRLADRVARPGLVLAGAEALGALLALGVPPLVRAAVRFEDLHVLPGGGAWLPAARAALVVLTSAVPSLALGASVPAALAALAPTRGRAGVVVAPLYAANTLGAVGGVLFATWVGLEALGAQGTVRAACAVEGAVAVLAALLLSGRRPRVAPPPTAEAPHALDVPRALRLAAALAGAAGIAVEIAWMRRLAPALGTTTYAFGTVLGAWLVATAAGAFLLAPRRARASRGRTAAMLALAAAPVLLVVPLLAPVAAAAGESLARALAQGPVEASTLFVLRAKAALLLLVPSVLIGAAALPWLVHSADPIEGAEGRAAGRLFCANGLGAAAGAALVGLLWLPAYGTAGVLRGAAGLYALGAGLVAGERRARAGLAVLGAALVASSFVAVPDEAAVRAVGATFDPGSTDPATAPVLFAREGRVSTVVVRDRDGRRELWVDGKVVASESPTDRLHLALLGHLPCFLHPAPRRVAVVGLGTGVTATACAAHAPDTLDVFELEPAVRDAAELFVRMGGGLPEGATFHAGDGRDGLRRSAGGFDVVTTDPIHPAAAGSSLLYTLEHFRLVAARLAPGGLACQWVPLYEMDLDDVRTVVRTFSAVFATAIFDAGPDLVLVGARDGFDVDPAALSARLDGPAGEGLAALGLRDAGRLLGLLVADPARARRFAGEGRVDGDDRPSLEFSSARAQYASSSSANLRALGVGASSPLGLLRGEPADPEAFRAGVARSKALRRALERWMGAGADDLRAASAAFERLAHDDPADAFCARMAEEADVQRGFVLLDAGRASEAADVARALLARAREGAVAPDVRQRIEAAAVLSAAGYEREAARAARAIDVGDAISDRLRRLRDPR